MFYLDKFYRERFCYSILIYFFTQITSRVMHEQYYNLFFSLFAYMDYQVHYKPHVKHKSEKANIFAYNLYYVK